MASRIMTSPFVGDGVAPAAIDAFTAPIRTEPGFLAFDKAPEPPIHSLDPRSVQPLSMKARGPFSGEFDLSCLTVSHPTLQLRPEESFAAASNGAAISFDSLREAGPSTGDLPPNVPSKLEVDIGMYGDLMLDDVMLRPRSPMAMAGGSGATKMSLGQQERYHTDIPAAITVAAVHTGAQLQPRLRQESGSATLTAAVTPLPTVVGLAAARTAARGAVVRAGFRGRWLVVEDQQPSPLAPEPLAASALGWTSEATAERRRQRRRTGASSSPAAAGAGRDDREQSPASPASAPSPSSPQPPPVAATGDGAGKPEVEMDARQQRRVRNAAASKRTRVRKTQTLEYLRTRRESLSVETAGLAAAAELAAAEGQRAASAAEALARHAEELQRRLDELSSALEAKRRWSGGGPKTDGTEGGPGTTGAAGEGHGHY
ncbi:hypothetical protein HK405_005704 [Cladochytrium tenue]|nr:hypothetical protein HK405_005704 [Cladochytrium tenue]